MGMHNADPGLGCNQLHVTAGHREDNEIACIARRTQAGPEGVADAMQIFDFYQVEYGLIQPCGAGIEEVELAVTGNVDDSTPCVRRLSFSSSSLTAEPVKPFRICQRRFILRLTPGLTQSWRKYHSLTAIRTSPPP